jgi:hypothetical protein
MSRLAMTGHLPIQTSMGRLRKVRLPAYAAASSLGRPKAGGTEHGEHHVRVDDQQSQPGADSLDPGSGWSRLVETRCDFAELARWEAEAAETRVAETRRQLDAQLPTLISVQTAVDPQATRAAKEEAQNSFHKAIRRATSRDQVELAAASWLAEINRINGSVRGAPARVQRERETTDALAGDLDRLTAIAEASRAMAESAVEACREAKQARAAAHAEEVAGAAGDLPSGPAAPVSARKAAHAALAPASIAAPPASIAAQPASSGAPPASAAGSAGDASPPEESELPVELRGPKPPMIVRLLQQDRATMSRLVDWLAGPDAEHRRRWQLCLSNFVDAVVATAIDNGCFVFTTGNAFWDQLTMDEAREVARGLAALGFRYDGMGEFADGRVPSQRELSMALGQAGLLTVRVRNWPGPEEAAQLYRQVRVDPIALLVEKAPSISMGELVLMLGRRAETVADLWNDWPRARPLLLLPSRE